MKKFINFTIFFCTLIVLLMVACAPGDKDLKKDDNNDSNPIDDNNTGANADKDIYDNKEKTLTGSAQGYGGEVTVKVVVSGEDIVSVEAVGKDETEGVGSLAIDELPDKIAQANSTKVDNVSGATKTSEGIKQAVNNALKDNIQSKQ
ncbi:MAG: FMN-binding protein [Tissierellia bacterium]|nr:FMN-binding protein [Tissierellia bacterium]MDD4439684.1 FMN-binding protein [Tissierellia bacterium]